MKILKLQPIIKNNLWGGHKLKKILNIKNTDDVIAEIWFLAGLSQDSNKISNNDNIADYIEKHGKNVLGSKSPVDNKLPLLIKVIDAQDNLSLQVHPNDEQAKEIGQDFGKNEMWHVLDTKPNNHIILGLNKDSTQKELKESIRNNTLLSLLNQVPIKNNETYFVEAGSIHAIKAGTLIFEVQQSSDTTYRLYDYDRRDKDNQPRELHVDMGLAVSNTKASRPKKIIEECLEDNANYSLIQLVSNQYFTVLKATVEDKMEYHLDKESFRSIVILSGHGYLILDDQKVDFQAGDSFFIPATDNYLIIRGKSTMMISHL